MAAGLRLMSQPQYRLRLREADTSNFRAPGDILLELDRAKNIGHSEYINDVGEAFFTLTQGDPKAEEVASLVDDLVHLQIYRDEDLVWAGWLGETDETETDVIFYAYSYAAALFWLHTDWNESYAGDQVDTIVTSLWTRAKSDLADTALRWITNGDIEAPVTTSGGATEIVIPDYTVNYKRILFALQELAAMSAGDTTNRVAFAITPAGQFNFWKNVGEDRTDVLWEYGGDVAAYRRIRTPMDSRNVVLGVGSSPRDIVLRRTDTSPTNITAKSRKEEAVFYSWIRDEDEVERVNKLRLKRALREDNQLALTFHPGRVIPAQATGASYAIGDMVPVRISNGATQLDASKLVVGQQVIFNRGVEIVRAIVQDSL